MRLGALAVSLIISALLLVVFACRLAFPATDLEDVTKAKTKRTGI